MARFLVLDWDYDQLCVLSGTVKHGAVRLHQAALWQEEGSPNPAEAEALGRRLRERLKAARMAPAPVFVCIGRDRVILKDIRHPPVPAAEEAAVVRFQVAKELTDAPEEVVIDYAPAAELGPAGEKRALAVILRRETLQTYRTLCRAAGLKLVGLTPRPFGTGALLRHAVTASRLAPAPQPPDAVVAVLTLSQPWAEFCLVDGDALVLARSLTAGANLAGEVRRNLAVYAGQGARRPVRALYVADAGEYADLRSRLQEMLDIPVHGFDPFGGARVQVEGQLAANPSALAGAVGLLYAQAKWRSLPINFVQPKEPRPTRDPNKRRVAVVAAAVAVFLLAGIAFCYQQLAARDQELAALFVDRANLERERADLENDLRRLKALEAWSDEDVVWLDELYDLTAHFPDPDKARLTVLTCGPLRRGGKEQHLAKVSLKGITNNDNEIDRLASSLFEDRHYRVGAKSVGRNTGIERFNFPEQFTLGFDLEKRPPSNYVRRLPDKSAGDRDRGGADESGGFGGFGGFGGGLP